VRALASLVASVLAAATASTAAAPPVERLAVASKIEPLGQGRGKLVLSFEPDSRYDFNRTPPITVEIEPASGIEWDRTRQLPRDGRPTEGSQYFGKIQPVEFTYTVSASSRPEVRIKVTYFYCSKKDGYCAREVKPLVIPLPRAS
jgi:hypothetical protein